MKILLVPVLWMSFALLTYPMWLADFQREFPTIAAEDCRKDMSSGIGFGLVSGPIGTFVEFFASGFAEHGMQWSCPSSPEAK